MSKNKSDVWLFRFILGAIDNSIIENKLGEELFDIVTDWIENNQLQLGGGYKNIDNNNALLFDFAIEHEKGEKIDNNKAGELFSLITYLYSRKDYLIIGGYSLPNDDDDLTFPLSIKEYKKARKEEDLKKLEEFERFLFIKEYILVNKFH